MIRAKHHPSYNAILNFQKLGIPRNALVRRVATAGLDPAVLDNPNLLVASPAGVDSALSPSASGLIALKTAASFTAAMRKPRKGAGALAARRALMLPFAIPVA